jgi:hypothetical protein
MKLKQQGHHHCRDAYSRINRRGANNSGKTRNRKESRTAGAQQQQNTPQQHNRIDQEDCKNRKNY